MKEFHKYIDCDRKVYVFAQVTFSVLTLASLYEYLMNIFMGKVTNNGREAVTYKKGYEERVALLEHLKVDRRKEVAQKLKEAREQGDLSENAEYDAAKDEQRDIETQIAELEEILKNAEVIQDDNTDSDAVKMESTVVLHDVEFDEDIEYVIVGSSEADSLNNKISNESPLGAAMLGKKVGDIVKVEAPIGVVEYKIVSVKND